MTNPNSVFTMITLLGLAFFLLYAKLSDGPGFCTRRSCKFLYIHNKMISKNELVHLRHYAKFKKKMMIRL